MSFHPFFAQIMLSGEYKIAALCMLTAFSVTMICIPPLIRLLYQHALLDIPDHRKEHSLPIPTLGGAAIFAGMLIAMIIWVPGEKSMSHIAFIFSLVALCCLGIIDDLKDLPALHKFLVQLALASLITLAGVRITSLGGILGIYTLPTAAQYLLTIFTIVGTTNAFNLIDGIDGLAGSLGFMSLIAGGILLFLSNEIIFGLAGFCLAGGLLGFLYFNYQPARIFMGDTGSLILGFTLSVIAIQVMQHNTGSQAVFTNAIPLAIGIVLIPVFDTLRVFAGRIWSGKSPFHPDKTHIHHLLTRAGFSHAFSTRLLCLVHVVNLVCIYLLRKTSPELTLLVLLAWMLLVSYLFANIRSMPRTLNWMMRRHEEFGA